MKYFYKDVIFMDHPDERVRKKKELFFISQCNAYAEEFRKNKDRLSNDIVEFEHNSHDALILSMKTIYRENRIDIAMEIKLERPTAGNMQNGTLMHYDVRHFFMDVINTCYGPNMGYTYGEILMEDDFWVHNFIFFPMPNEICIKCKKLEWIN